MSTALVTTRLVATAVFCRVVYGAVRALLRWRYRRIAARWQLAEKESNCAPCHSDERRLGDCIPEPPPKPHVRSAEKMRVSTCRFADVVAESAISKFRDLCAQCGLEYKQTVMAAIVLIERDAAQRLVQCSVVSLGAGTKFLRQAQILTDLGGCRVRDCHAEVLARRGLQRFLRCQLERCLRSNDCIFEKPASKGDKFRLRKGLTFHLYSSSQPCGNASIKRWAKGGAGKSMPGLPSDVIPDEKHPRLQVLKHARAEGMVALSVKREPAAVSEESAEEAATSAGRSACADQQPRADGAATARAAGLTAASHATAPVMYASGTAAVGGGHGQLLSCSDKICRWNALGLQGGLLALLMEPVFLTSVCVGRRFSKLHLQRALCCRIQDFDPASGRMDALPRGYGVRHPSMLCTSAKLDDGAIDTSGASGLHAQFGELRCLCWSADAAPDVIDGAEGSLHGSHATSSVSSGAMLGAFRALCAAAAETRLLPTHAQTLDQWLQQAERRSASGSAPTDSYREEKARIMRNSDYAAARSLLLSKTEFRAWPKQLG